ncbi:MAG TPA: glycine--tRNA ligase subunit beta [Candidatus Limnocylindria bacterium]|nr:glycine--tRNA ligase subunit beta [Candidatus Limnocylindria bacterium]
MTRELLFEIGVEELPSSYIPPALAQLEREARAGLADLRLGFGAIDAFGTPRRLVLSVAGLEERQSDFAEEALGPAVRVAYDGEGKPTKALEGFCRGKGVDLSAVRRVTTAKGEYVTVTVHHTGRPAADVLPGLLAGLATRLVFPKSMRWTAAEFRFARPVRWLTALLGEQVLPVHAFDLDADRISQGHRFLSPGPISLARATDYVGALERAHVIADHRVREARLRERVEALAKESGGRVVHDDELLAIDNFLVEWPNAFAGRFDAEFLSLPREVIVTALREHQRFFAVEDRSGKLLPAFVAVRNGDDRGLDQVRRGNQDVLAARLADARFYWETDLKHAPAERVATLASVVWMEGLGSLRDKAGRLQALVEWLAERLSPRASAAARRAALVCKTDLLSEMIGSGKEYASLEGVMGGYYARAAGEPEDVAAAIAEHYRPRGSGDSLPAGEAGALLSIADKLDHVAGAFVAGKPPSGSEDPYGVRRAGNGVVRILIEQERRLDLRDATLQSTAPFFAANAELPHAALVRQLGEFWRGRVEAALDERGLPYDARDAALEAQVGSDGAARVRPGWIDPSDGLRRARVLAGFRSDPRFEPLVILFKRVANILKAASETLPAVLDRARLTEPAERDLLAALEQARARTAPLWQERDYERILPALLELEVAIHGFFDHVMVNVEDAPTRLNRLRLLAEVRELFARGWDLSRVVVEGERSATAERPSEPTGAGRAT